MQPKNFSTDFTAVTAGLRPTLAGITIYPIKSLDGIALEECAIAQPGGLTFDRRWMIVDEQGGKINGKREPKVHTLRASFDLAKPSVTLTNASTGGFARLDLAGERRELAAWLSEYFGKRVEVLENVRGGFPDDATRPGPTVISRATLQTVASWLPGLDEAETGRRFRANLLVDGVPPFWEDGLYRADESTGGIPFRVGADVVLEGVNPCLRCVVPTRDTRTGDEYGNFTVTMMKRRLAELPEWTHAERFEKPFRLAVNTRLAEPTDGPAILRRGDRISVLR